MVDTVDGIGIIRLTAIGRFDQAVDAVADALRQGLQAGLGRLMVVIPESGMNPPSVAERVHMVRTWAEIAAGRIRVAIVAPAELFDPDRLGVVAARGFGLEGNAFLHEDEALDWLREQA